jgi:hypothetical protein
MKKTIFLTFTLLSISLGFSQTFTVNDIDYQVTSTSPAEVKTTNYKGTATTVNIPASVDNGGVTYSVTSIGDSSFILNFLTSVTIPDSVTSIGDSAFKFNDLTSVTIPNSVINIGNDSFNNNILTSVTIPNSVTSIGNYAFSFNSLTSVTIPDSVANIGDRAFHNNYLTSVIIGAGVTSIGDNAFSNNSLTSVTIPNSVTSIGDSAFRENSLTSVTISSSVTSIGFATFASNSLTSVTIPNSVTSIGNFAFASNSLTSVTIPNSVTNIGRSAFQDNSLTLVIIGEGVTSIGDNAFLVNADLAAVTSTSTNPATLTSDAFDDNSTIDLCIPSGATANYTDKSWIGFNSVNEGCALSITTDFIEKNIRVHVASNKLYLHTNNTLNIEAVQLFSIHGSRIVSTKETTISLSGLAQGMYIALIKTNKGVVSKKFVLGN